MLPAPGQIVRARSRQYLVEDVVAPPERGDDTLVRLSCLDDDAQGEPLDVLWEHELDAEILTERDWRRAAERGFDSPALFSAYLHALRWGCVTATTPRLFQAPYRAGIEMMAYQLDPLRKALQYPFVNLFIADDTGLGKTIEAGLVVRELMMRQKRNTPLRPAPRRRHPGATAGATRPATKSSPASSPSTPSAPRRAPHRPILPRQAEARETQHQEAAGKLSRGKSPQLRPDVLVKRRLSPWSELHPCPISR